MESLHYLNPHTYIVVVYLFPSIFELLRFIVKIPNVFTFLFDHFLFNIDDFLTDVVDKYNLA